VVRIFPIIVCYRQIASHRVRCYDVSADVIDVSDIIDDQYLVTFLVPTAIFFAA